MAYLYRLWLPGNKSFAEISAVTLGVGLLLAVLHYALPSFNKAMGLPILFVVVMTLGLVHGSLDFHVETAHKPNLTISNFTLKYWLQMLFVASCWFLLPALAFTLFILMTAWHFGETDFSLFKVKAHPITILLYGLGITSWVLLSPMVLDLDNVLQMRLIPDLDVFHHTDPKYMKQLVRIVALVLIAAAILISPAKSQSGVWLLLGMLLLLTYLLPIWLGFTLYFGFWHSLHSIQLIKVDIRVSAVTLMRKASPYLLASIVITSVTYFIVGIIQVNSPILLFICISAMTLPHATVMHGLLKRHISTQ